MTDPLGRITTTTYDNRGWVATVTIRWVTWSPIRIRRPAGGAYLATSRRQRFDRLVLLRQRRRADHGHGPATITPRSYAYDGVGNQITVTDANSNTTTYAYDSMNRLTTITDALGDTTVYGYDSGGNQITVTDGLGHTATTLYDALNRATTMTSAIRWSHDDHLRRGRPRDQLDRSRGE